MSHADGCTDDPIVIDERSFAPVRYGEEWPPWDTTYRCHDCHALPGQVHHHGCDVEECPDCGRQSISCGCLWAGEEGEDAHLWTDSAPRP